jgi:hypothetical protein
MPSVFKTFTSDKDRLEVAKSEALLPIPSAHEWSKALGFMSTDDGRLDLIRLLGPKCPNYPDTTASMMHTEAAVCLSINIMCREVGATIDAGRLQSALELISNERSRLGAAQCAIIQKCGFDLERLIASFKDPDVLEEARQLRLRYYDAVDHFVGYQVGRHSDGC